MRRTKIICTLGPATESPETIREMVQIGMNVARINMSHGTHEEHRLRIERVRDVATELGRPVAVLADLAGPKIRVGDLPEPIRLRVGTEVRLAAEDAANGDVIPVTYEHFDVDLSPGDRILLDDGLLELERLETPGGEPGRFKVIRGGLLKAKKGLNMPGVSLQARPVTEKDRTDLAFALDQGVEYVGLSFVGHAQDVLDLKEKVGKRALIVAKIELARALDGLEDIVEATDMVMVARGDLGVEVPFEQVPLAQKRIVQLANYYSRPVITATQMLESMIDHPVPTRAEASDVANAILDGTDAIMLSGETAVGNHPLLALTAMTRIAREIEDSGVLESGPTYDRRDASRTAILRRGATAREHAVASATVDAARSLDAPAIIVITRSGKAARLVSSYRPGVPVFAVCRDEFTFRQLGGVWGVHPVVAENVDVSYESLEHFGRQCVVEAGVGEEGQPVVVTAGFPFDTSGSTNTMRVETL